MRMIQIDDEVFAEIQKVAVPLVDDANGSLRRVFGLPSAAPRAMANGHDGRQRLERGKLTPHSVLRRHIYEVLIGHGGSARRQLVLVEMAKKLDGRLTESDTIRTRTGECKWENRASWERQNMTIAGLLVNGAPHGIWQLTEAGEVDARAFGLGQ